MMKQTKFLGKCLQGAGSPVSAHARAIIWNVWWMLLSACAAALIGELLINGIYYGQFRLHFASIFAGTANVIILFCFFMIMLVAVNRTFVAVTLGATVYGIMILADILKLSHFDNPLRPTDLQYLPDLKVIAKASLGWGTIAVAAFALAAVVALVVILWRRERRMLFPVARVALGGVAAGFLISFFVFPAYPAPRGWLQVHGIELPEWWQFEPRGSAQLNGLLVEWAMTVGELSVHRPEGYSYSEISRIGQAYPQQTTPNATVNGEKPPNLIVFLVESFMDPQDLGVRFTADPIPAFRALSGKFGSGRVVVPVFGGTSANTEFEVLTGMSMAFLPDDSCPYRQYINEDIPSLPRILHQYGYRTEAVLADPSYLFSRKKVLGHLGFDRWNFPESDPTLPQTPDGDFAADSVIADAAINASRMGSPFFFLGFTGGTHCPWEYSDYDNSPLDVVGPMAPPARKRLKTYINALRVADSALEKMIRYYEKSDQKTMILIMGDHLPPLEEIYDITHFFKEEKMEEMRQRYSVPAVLWANYPLDAQDFICSANFVPAMLIRKMGLPQQGIFALSGDLYSRLPVFSRYVQTADGHLFEPESAGLPFRRLIGDYRMVQYDLLLGKQYALGIPGWGLAVRKAEIQAVH